jgi:4-nitrophenyl phosphatase
MMAVIMGSTSTPQAITTGALLDRYAGVLLDAYGVLIDASGPLPGARELIVELDRRGLPWAVVTNDASRSPTTYAAKFSAMDLPITGARVVTSGSLIPGYFAAHGLAGARTAVLGTDDSRAYVVAGGGVVVELAPGMEIDALAVCDDDGFPFLRGIELALSAVVRAVERTASPFGAAAGAGQALAVERTASPFGAAAGAGQALAVGAGRRPALILPNPDLVYPKGGNEYGFTAGAMAMLIEAALARRFPTLAAELRFVHLGKPSPLIFEAAARHVGIAHERLVMIGDQLDTDVRGARAAGIDVALLAGVSRWEHAATHAEAIAPTYLLASLAP